MKLILLAAFFISLSGPHLGAQEPKPITGKFVEPFILPKGDLRALLEIVAKIHDRQIVVANEKELDLGIPFMLPAPVSPDVVVKTVESVLLLEGYGLVDEAGEIHLRKLLTEEQCNALNKALGRVRGILPEQTAKRSIITLGPGGEVISEKPVTSEKTWIVVRPGIKK